MRHPDHVSRAFDILYTLGGELDNERIQAILDNYDHGSEPDRDPVEIRQISYDGGPLGAWVNCDVSGQWEWVYVAAGDNENRQMIVLAASEKHSKGVGQ